MRNFEVEKVFSCKHSNNICFIYSFKKYIYFYSVGFKYVLGTDVVKL